MKPTPLCKALLLSSALTAPLIPITAHAGVTLESADGSINLTGELVEFTDEFYLLSTPLGELRVSAERVRCIGEDCPQVEQIEANFSIVGSDAVGATMMPLLLQGFATSLEAEASIVAGDIPGEALASFIGDFGFGDDLESFRIASTTSTDAFEQLLARTADVGMSARRIVVDEARALRADDAGNMVSVSQEHIVAVDSIVIIAHPSNPVNSLTMDQIADIFSGQIINWSELGGPDMMINVVSRQDGSGTRSSFEDRIFGDGARLVGNAMIATDSSTLANIVTDDPAAIGYVGYAFQRGAKPISLVNACGIEVSPTPFTAKTEEYPLQQRMYLYNRADVDPKVAAFIDYALSPEAENLIAKAGFIDLGITSVSYETDSPRIMALEALQNPYEREIAQSMMEKLESFERLSTTFRFRTGSSRLDERGTSDIARLISHLEVQPEGTKVALVGFTDDVGAFDANRDLSVGRAEAVASQIAELAPDLMDRIELTATGFGELSPVACNASDGGRAINRRVEVWLGTDSSQVNF